MKLFVRNMVCHRCIMAVERAFEKAGMNPLTVSLGEVEVVKQPSANQLDTLNSELRSLGFELLDDQRRRMIEKIKALLIEKVQSGEIEEHFSLSEFISKKQHKEYSQLSRLFSEVEGITVEQFFLLQKIEKVKEWIVYDELNLSEIAWKLGYSSVAHLSAQFKKLTGMTPSHFRQHGPKQRKPLDQIVR